jgi:hypothetical protein
VRASRGALHNGVIVHGQRSCAGAHLRNRPLVPVGRSLATSCVPSWNALQVVASSIPASSGRRMAAALFLLGGAELALNLSTAHSPRRKFIFWMV